MQYTRRFIEELGRLTAVAANNGASYREQQDKAQDDSDRLGALAHNCEQMVTQYQQVLASIPVDAVDDDDLRQHIDELACGVAPV